jgi:imidazoleglycerol-phosphate dehydratase
MDESLAICSIDLSQRAHLVFDCILDAEKIGDFETINLKNFFSGFVQGSMSNLHVKVPYGSDPHHIVEAVFKAFGKALQMAVARSNHRWSIPSTKGVL